MKLSKYTRIVDESESEVVIYNTINRGIISIEKENIDKATMTLIRLSENEVSLLKEMEFLESSVDLAQKKEEYEDENTLIIKAISQIIIGNQVLNFSIHFIFKIETLTIIL